MSATKTKRKPRASAPDAGALAPDPDLFINAHVARKFRVWLGCRPECPREQLDVAGIDFPKAHRRLVRGDRRSMHRMKLSEASYLGSVRELTEDQLRRIKGALPRVFVRVGEPPADDPDPRRPGPGKILTLPDPAEEKKIRDAHLEWKIPTLERTDKPAATLVWLQYVDESFSAPELTDDFDGYPDTLDKTGLEIPDGDE